MSRFFVYAPLRLYVFALGCLFFALPVSAQEAESTSEPNVRTELNIFDNFYNHESGWHVFIPEGWVNDSTDEYARFSRDFGAIFAVSYPDAPDIETAIDQAIAVALPDFNGTQVDTRELSLINGVWTQRLYRQNARYVTLHAQDYDGTFYVLIYSGSDAAVPLIVTSEDASADTTLARVAITDAARLIEPLLGEPTDITAQAAGDIPNLSLLTYTNTDGGVTTALGRVRGNAVYVVVGTGGITTLNETSVYFTSLNDFFITPNTTPYLVLGIGLSTLIAAILVISLILRRQNLLKDEATLRQLDSENA